ncbi:phosphohistidine phosphatase SixA [Acidipila rosea]|uniref:Phosphohistidine phosphatase SixA n=1 Tax=Acidipila rosea TaxID=768535 RepID=A0A4R1LD09_9BACT|nr:phosphohistidine phosphatase SixA [Acidipila rosea]MBW4027057.1 phosphohistidine phosphatase SixA [Acidobacteriota bacterium]MBW4045125.1 phosphohistidine phosphatase SixA [Acidobacteriota bacterium]TCK75360.1 phosphohistidine phosphatase SixA [Acidipila rosea]
MNVYILRHASAGTRRANPVIDVRRPLDKEGKQQCILIASYLNALRVQFDLVVSSPLKRALQTASMVATETGYESKIMVSEALAPGASVTAFLTLVDDLSVYENVLLVGHNPNLPQFLGALIASPGRAAVRLRKGAIARVDSTRRPGTLHWLVDPRILRGLYTRVTKSSLRKTSRK